MHISAMESIRIEELKEVNNNIVADLAALTLDIVQGGASVGFMQNISKEKAAQPIFTKTLNRTPIHKKNLQ